MSIMYLLRKQKRGGSKYGFSLALVSVFFIAIVSLLNPTVISADGFLKPTGTAEGDVVVWIPDTSVDGSFLMTADYIAEADLPSGITYPPSTVGQAFTFGLWQGDSTTIRRFIPSIVLNVAYRDDDVLLADRPDEQFLHLYMYDPATETWVRLCSSVDVHENVVYAALSYPTPFEADGSSLMALAIDRTPPLEQTLDGQGTTITLPGSNLRLQIPLQAVEDGTHFAITQLPRVSNGGAIRLPTRPVDIKACRVDRDKPQENNRQLTDFFKLLQIGYDYDSDTLSRAGGRANLTIGKLQNGRWIDVEEIGSRVTRGRETIAVDTSQLGTSGLAIR